MVTTTKARDIDVEQTSQTERLANWIGRVRCKKLMCRKNRKRDLRVEAVLTCALVKAEVELRNKQLSRISRWQQLKKQFLKELDYNNYDLYKAEDDTLSNSCQRDDPWQAPLCPELSSLDSFMLKLAEIKIPLQR